MKTLYLFTYHFPFSTPENFLEVEILYLSRKFDRVVILPFNKGEGKMREVPSNCEVHTISPVTNKIHNGICGIVHYKTIGVLTKEFFRSKVFISWKRFRSWVAYGRCLNNYLYNKKLQSVLSTIRKEDVCYFYWGTGQCMLSIFLKGKAHLVSRFHGYWDLWEESYGGFQPLRTDVAHCLDRAIFISKKGEEYFKKRYSFVSTIVSPLGTKDFGIQMSSPKDGVVRVVSCSFVYPLKRVPLIFEALNVLDEYIIEWTHLGGGSDLESLKQLIKEKKKEHLTIFLTEEISNKEVLEYYSNHHFDLFVNLSSSEGVPVSIMEASSFDIPILATDVGATSEEVPPQVGELIPANPTIAEITGAIRKILTSEYSPRKFWFEHYSADRNYSAFADMLYNLE